MKSLKQIRKKHKDEEIAESLVLPVSLTSKERAATLSEFSKFRKKIADEQTPKSKLISQLLQLRFQIEDYLGTEKYNDKYYFGYFLKQYIDKLEKKNKEFAEEINVNTTELSQIINKHRKPTDKLIYRLEIHSNRNFPAIFWFRVLEKEREFELKNNKHLIESEKKFVKKGLSFKF